MAANTMLRKDPNCYLPPILTEIEDEKWLLKDYTSQQQQVSEFQNPFIP